MAAHDHTSANTAPLIDRLDELGETWQELQLPPWTTRVEFHATDDVYIGFAGSAGGGTIVTPTHGGALGGHYTELAAGGSYVLPINPPPRTEWAGLNQITSVFVRAQQGASKVCTVIMALGGA